MTDPRDAAKTVFASRGRHESVRARMASLLLDIADRNPDVSWLDLAAFGIRALDGEK